MSVWSAADRLDGVLKSGVPILITKLVDLWDTDQGASDED